MAKREPTTHSTELTSGIVRRTVQREHTLLICAAQTLPLRRTRGRFKLADRCVPKSDRLPKTDFQCFHMLFTKDLYANVKVTCFSSYESVLYLHYNQSGLFWQLKICLQNHSYICCNFRYLLAQITLKKKTFF